MSAWAKLRPCDRDLGTFLRWANVIEGIFLSVAGTWAIVNFWRLAIRPNAIQFVVFIYIVTFGILLVSGELGIPAFIYTYFGILATPSGRAWFLFFVATLALSSGLSFPRNAVDHILMTIAGTAGLVLTPLSLCYGQNYTTADGSGLHLPSFGRSQRSGGPNPPPRGTPDVEI